MIRQGLITAWVLAAAASVAHAQAPAPVPAAATNPLADAQPSGTFIALSVTDAAASARWYQEVLGFRVVTRIEPGAGPGQAVLLENGTAILELVQHSGARAREAWHADAKQPFLVRGYFKAGFRVSHLDRMLQALRDRKVEIRHGPFDVPDFKLRSFIAVDPDGNLLQFFGA